MDQVKRLPKTGKYLLGVSGGCDSMTLLSLCLKEKLNVIVCFVNYGVRESAGMEEQMRTLANDGMLANFVGMLTDSRSFLSYTRHEYFRRIMCNLIGGWVENGEFPADMEMLEEIVKNISYYNSKTYFKLPVK